MRFAIGSDHAGFELKQHLVDFLHSGGHEVIDLGTDSTDPVDYPPICAAVGRHVVQGRIDRGIVLGGSGQGEQIAANKVRGVRAALCNDLYTSRLSRAHNDANVLAMGARIVGFGLAEEILNVWVQTDFDGGRHQRRIDQIADLETQSRHRIDLRWLRGSEQLVVPSGLHGRATWCRPGWFPSRCPRHESYAVPTGPLNRPGRS